MASSIEPKHIIEGFSDDLQVIQDEFSKCSQDLRFEEFLAFWRASHMDCIFANRFDPRELLESIVAMNEKLVSIITDDLKESSNKLIGLYSLTCISAKQPCRLRRKIRMTCYDAIKMSKLCDEISQSYGHQDATFCWYYLRKIEAIDFAEERVIHGPSMLKNRKQQGNRQVDPSVDSLETQDQRNRVGFIETRLEPTLDELNMLTHQYTQIREVLQLDPIVNATAETQTRSLVQDHLDQARNLLRDFEASQI